MVLKDKGVVQKNARVMKIALMGQYYSTLYSAINKMNEKNLKAKADNFVVIEFGNGFLVVSKAQIEQVSKLYWTEGVN